MMMDLASSSVVAALAAAHQEQFASAPTWAAAAPGQLCHLGDISSSFGGVPIYCTVAQNATCVASATTGQSKVFLNGENQPELAQKVDKLIKLLKGRQLYARQCSALAITMSCDLPAQLGLGEEVAQLAAIALVAAAVDADFDATVRAKLAETCASLCSYSPERFHVALRGFGENVTVIDYRDDSLTSAPPVVGYGLQAVVIADPKTKAATVDLANLTGLMAKAAAAFGVPNLRLLPDAATRLAGWAEAHHEVLPKPDIPPTPQVMMLFDVCTLELQAAQTLIGAVRSRRNEQAMEQIQRAHTLVADCFPLGEVTDLAAWAQANGALAARGTDITRSSAIVAYVTPTAQPGLIAAATNAGLEVLPLTTGFRASFTRVNL